MAIAKPQNILLQSEDGFPLGATLYRGGSRYLLVSPAMAVSANIYRAFAEHLQGRGFSVLLYDYRGMGGSKPGGADLRSLSASVTDWALKDQRTALRYLLEEHEPEFLHLLGHSLGGQIAGLNGDLAGVDSMVMVCSVNGHWRYQEGLERYKVALHTHLTLPLLSRLFGYMPWSRLAPGQDIPKQAALQWARWCRQPDYLFSDRRLPLERFRRFEAPVLSLAVSDDPWCTDRAIENLIRHYPNGRIRPLRPEDWGLSRLGHFGFFKPTSSALWDALADWLRHGF